MAIETVAHTGPQREWIDVNRIARSPQVILSAGHENDTCGNGRAVTVDTNSALPAAAVFSDFGLVRPGTCKSGVSMDVLVIDIGGSSVKMTASGSSESRRFKSGATLTPVELVRRVKSLTADWHYDVVAIGYPGAVNEHGPTAEPGNLGPGWVDFDFQQALGVPVRIVNDAVMQALGGYQGGRMLFLGLGTGIGSSLITEHVIIPLELGCLLFGTSTVVERLGRPALDAHGVGPWKRDVAKATRMLRAAFAADYVLLGGGNARKVIPLPEGTRRGGNTHAFKGGFRLWEETMEPHDRTPPPVWRVVR